MPLHYQAPRSKHKGQLSFRMDIKYFMDPLKAIDSACRTYTMHNAFLFEIHTVGSLKVNQAKMNVLHSHAKKNPPVLKVIM